MPRMLGWLFDPRRVAYPPEQSGQSQFQPLRSDGKEVQKETASRIDGQDTYPFAILSMHSIEINVFNKNVEDYNVFHLFLQ